MRELIERLEQLPGLFAEPLYRSAKRRALLDFATSAGLNDEDLGWFDGALGGSLDAAVKLVPNGHAWQVRHKCSRDGDVAYCNAQVWRYSDPRDDDVPRHWASHEHAALAIVIAALKAREAGNG